MVTAEEDHHECSGCGKPLPKGNLMPAEWLSVHVEEWGASRVKDYYLYVCPHCDLNVTRKQKNLFLESEPDSP